MAFPFTLGLAPYNQPQNTAHHTHDNPYGLQDLIVQSPTYRMASQTTIPYGLLDALPSIPLSTEHHTAYPSYIVPSLGLSAVIV